MMMGQNAMFGGQAAYAQQLSYPMQAAMHPGMAPPPPPPPPPMGMMQAARGAHGGMYGEQVAAQMGSTAIQGAHMGMGAMGVGLGAATMAVGGPVGLALGAAAMIPAYVGGKAIDVYGGNFMEGMNQQAALNSTLRQNFNFFGGQGRMGRGFNQGQMGQIGQVIQQELNQNVFASAGELNQLISGGAEAGMMTGVRDVQQFAQKFRRMLNTLKDVQRELGGSLTDALAFVRQSRQAGIFQQVDQSSFAVNLRGAEAASGLNRDQLMGLATQGAQMSRAVGGFGRQGAQGALRMASTLGGAIQSGAINEELLSEATGGLTGSDAVQAMVGQMMQRTARFSRRGMGRFSMFAMSNASGTGLDPAMMDRFLAGDISTSEVSRAAHRNVNRMGRARAMNNEGVLRGAMMEQGGLAGQIGMMRLMLGDRVMNMSDDMSSLVMQRRFGMNRPQAELMQSLIRNQGSIAEQEAFSRVGAQRQQALQTDIRENRSVDAFMRHVQHGLESHTGVTRAREMGRTLMSRVSSMVERAMNDALGVAENQISQGDRQALNRMAMGTATADDFAALGISEGGIAGLGRAAGGDQLDQRGLLQFGRTAGQTLRLRGVSTQGLTAAGVRRETEAAQLARGGILTLDRDREALRALQQDADGTMLRIGRAQLQAMGGGDPSSFYQDMGEGANANAIDAFMARRGLANPGAQLSRGMMMRRGGGALTGGGVMRDLGRLGLAPGLFLGAGAAMFARGDDVGTVGQALGFESLQALGTDREMAANFLSRGGDLAGQLRASGVREQRSLAQHMVSPNRGAMAGLAGMSGPMALAGNMAGGVLSYIREQRQGTTADQRLLQGITGVDQQAMEAVLGNQEIRQSLQGVLGSESGGEQRRRLAGLTERALGMEEGTQRQALLSVVEQIRRGSKGGTLGEGNLRTQLQRATAIDPRRRAQLLEEFADTGAGFSRIARSFYGAGLGAEGQGGRLAQRIGQAYFGHGELASDPDALMRAQQEFTSTLAGMDPESEEYRRLVRGQGQPGEEGFREGLGSFAEGRAQLASAANERRLVRDLSGGGRRGGRQAAETQMRMLTGGLLGEMDLSVMRGGRERQISTRNRAQQVQRILMRGGDDATRLLEQMQSQLEEQGVEGAGDILSRYQQRLSSGRGLDEDEARDMTREMRGNKDLQRVQREALERRQRAQNPLDTTRNDLLQRIANNIQNLNPNSPPSTGEGAQQGGGGGITISIGGG